jgi:hypothetical protein
MKEHTETYSNLEQKMPTGAEEILKNGNVYIAHTAWDHWGKMYYENGKFKEDVWRQNEPMGTIEGDALEEVFEKVNDQYGWK